MDRAVAFGRARPVGPPADPGLRVTVNFHPDRRVGRLPLLEVLARDGVYRSQVETGTSNGGLTAHPGGDRWAWESRLFGGAYDDAPPAQRPKYGALDVRRRAVGGSPRFGSAHPRAGLLDPAVIGAAARSGKYDEQVLERVWHLLARSGEPPVGAPDAAR